MRDFLTTLVLLLIVAAGFYAFQLLVLGIVGLVVYWALPTIRKLHSKGKLWK